MISSELPPRVKRLALKDVQPAFVKGNVTRRRLEQTIVDRIDRLGVKAHEFGGGQFVQEGCKRCVKQRMDTQGRVQHCGWVVRIDVGMRQIVVLKPSVVVRVATAVRQQIKPVLCIGQFVHAAIGIGAVVQITGIVGR